MKTKINFILIIFSIILINNVNAFLYDDFSSGTLDTNKWEIRQDVEGQPFMDEYGVLNETGNFIFHTKNNIVDKRVAIVPTYNFSAGESFDYDVDYISGSGNHGHILLVITTEYPNGDYIRAGILGFNNVPDTVNIIGKYHIKLKINSNNLEIIRKWPDNTIQSHTLGLSNPDSKYKLYIESWGGHNGLTHIDYDNFIINQKCGDVNLDDNINLADIIFLVNYVFKGGQKPLVLWASDFNSDNLINIADIIYLVNYIFKGGPEPICQF